MTTLLLLLFSSSLPLSTSSSSSHEQVYYQQKWKDHNQRNNNHNNDNQQDYTTIHPIGHDIPWIPGPHPHRTYNSTTRTWSRHRRSLQTNNNNNNNPNHETEQEEEEDIHQTNVRQYLLWKPEEIAETVQQWSKHYSSVLQVTTAQDAYQLPTAGGTQDCPFDSKVTGCLNYILIIQDRIAHPTTATTDGTSTEYSASSQRLPDVLWSGELHGNERVGPTAVLEATQLLLDAALCESLPRMVLHTSGDAAEWAMELQRAHECRHDLYDRGINDIHRKWLARLVTTRRIVVVPTANALGYYQNTREENRIDPNRDFPYDQTDPAACMQTIAGRTLNEIFRQHLFQLSLTFHGGMEVIGYEWGAPSYSGRTSPDDVAQHAIAQAYSQYAGSFGTTPAYPFGPMNDLVYPVNGGMEDWAYAGSWDANLVTPCDPITYDGYPKSQTIYDNSTLRVFNMLVETSNHKTPYQYELGTSLDIMTISPTGNGHVARNIRLALLAVEFVQPYVVIESVNGIALSDDIIPSVVRGGTLCQTTKVMAVPRDHTTVTVQWVVGGAVVVDQTSLHYTKWDTKVEALLDCEEQPDLTQLLPLLTTATMTSSNSGTTKFGSDSAKLEATLFSATIDVSKFAVGDQIVVVAMARVDQNWGKSTDHITNRDVGPKLGPQSHVVNARTNPDWYHSTKDGSKVIQGRLDWISIPLTIVLKDYSNIVPVPAAEEISLRYDISEIPGHDDDETNSSKSAINGPTTSGASSRSNPSTVLIWFIAMVVVVSLIGFAGRTYLQHSMRYTHRERVREYIQDEHAITPGLQIIADEITNGNGSTTMKRFTDTVDEPDEADRAHGVELGTYT